VDIIRGHVRIVEGILEIIPGHVGIIEKPWIDRVIFILTPFGCDMRHGMMEEFVFSVETLK
jgi:hypothetical protein